MQLIYIFEVWVVKEDNCINCPDKFEDHFKISLSSVTRTSNIYIYIYLLHNKLNNARILIGSHL